MLFLIRMKTFSVITGILFTGTAERNIKLSLERAQQVAAALRLYEVETNRLVPKGFGSEKPAGDNSTAEGRQLNRRVELVRIN